MSGHFFVLTLSGSKRAMTVAERLFSVKPSQGAHDEAETLAVLRRKAGYRRIAKHEQANPHVVIERNAH